MWWGCSDTISKGLFAQVPKSISKSELLTASDLQEFVKAYTESGFHGLCRLSLPLSFLPLDSNTPSFCGVLCCAVLLTHTSRTAVVLRSPPELGGGGACAAAR